MKVLLTGGLGYIGSHTAVELLDKAHEVVIIDNLSNSSKDVKNKIEQITEKKVAFIKADVRDEGALRKIFKKHSIDAVVHFAGLKAVGESVEKPIEYYDNNLFSTISLLKVMKEFGVKKLIFSSSATVYGRAKSMPIYEDFPTSVTNPYGRTKLFIEEILRDVYVSDPSFKMVILRYFNPIGAHKSGLIGEDPNGIPNNLMPYVTRVSLGLLPILSVFGDDYQTKDGTGVRDYIHVVDLAKGHVAAIDKLAKKDCGYEVYNLGTGKGYSVLDIIKEYNKVCGGKVKYKIVERRPGDIDICYACPDKAKKELGWSAKYNLEDMCKDSFNFGKTSCNKKQNGR